MKLPKLTLTVVAGPTQGQKYSSELPFLVGRTRASNKCTIKDPEVSSKHIELRAEQGKWVLCELGSSNGTYLNQDAVEQPDDNEDRGARATAFARTAFLLYSGERPSFDIYSACRLDE